MDANVRAAEPNDLESLVWVFLACWRTSYREILPEQIRNEMTELKARDLWALSVQPHADRKTFVVEIDSQVVGMARVGIDTVNSTRGHLFSLYVHPDFAGKGLGKKLLRHCFESLAASGFEEISLWVFKNNSSTRKLYGSFGFVETGQERIDDRWKNPEIKMLAPSKLS